MKIAVVGLGYVGLPLSLQFARSCVSVLGIDVDPSKIELLNNGQSYIKHIERAGIAELLSSGKFSASTDFRLIKGVEAVVLNASFTACGGRLSSETDPPVGPQGSWAGPPTITRFF